MRIVSYKSFLGFLILMLPLAFLVPAVAQQGSRGTILGTVVDQSKAVIPGVSVVLTHLDTNQARTTQTNSAGYYEFPLLNPGNYALTAEISGFRKYSRTGIVLNVAGRVNIDFTMEVGGMTEVVQVSEAAPLLETTSASSGRIIDNAQIVSLPFSDLNPFALTNLSAGMQWTGQPEYRRPFDNGGTSSFNTAGGVGQNEYTIDGAPVTGTNRRVGFVPPADAIQEFKLQTGAFDATVGHTSGAIVNVESKSGTNAWHGSIYEQHWQQRWNATMHFPRLAWENNVKTGAISPDTPKQGPGRSNQFGATIGAPVRIPWLYNGTDKFFFFFSYNGIYQSKAETTSSVNRDVPKMAWRQGDFSDLLAIDPAKYQIYDPRTARQEGSRVVRDPFPGNTGIPILNPLYKFYEQLYPKPNDVPGLVSPEGYVNYLAAQMPKDERFNSILNRFDYLIGTNHRIDGKWFWNHRLACEYDWTYETLRGLHCNGLTRINKGGGGNYTWTINSRNVFQLGTSWSRFNEGNENPVQTSFKPSDVGLPSYLDDQAADNHFLPRLDFDSLEDVGGSYPTITSRGTTFEVKGQMNTIIGSHSLKYGYGERRYWFASAGPGYSSSTYSYRRDYMRKNDADTLASHHGLEWAAFMMGVPSEMRIDINDTGYWSTPFRYLYLQDDWRLSSSLTLNLGLRFEHESGITERFNRALDGNLIADAKLPITDAVQTAYSAIYDANPGLGLLPPSQFKVLGGIPYLSENNKAFSDGYKRLLPRAGFAYNFRGKTVLRMGYGLFSDTFNVNNTRLNQWGYSQSTYTTLTSDLGLNFCCGIGPAANLSATNNPLGDPFPVRPDGSRFDAPLANYLDLMSRVGRDYNLAYSKAYKPDMQQRWRIGIQHQIRSDMVIEGSYNGAYSRIGALQRINYLPGQYWATGDARVQAIDDDLNRNVTNPFYIGNLGDLQASDPKLYNHLATNSFFTSRTIRKNQLLRMFPQFSGTLAGLRPGVDFEDARGKNMYNDFQIEFTKRMSQGFATNFSWTHTWNCKESDWYANEFDELPSWRPQDAAVPNRWVWSTILQMPFGRGRRWVQNGWLEHFAGGWEVNWIYNLQDGPPAGDWGNRFFYGDMNNLEALFNHKEVWSNDIHQWFDPNVPFEKSTAKQPGSYHVRVFPTRLAELRRDGIDNWDIKIMKRFRLTESANARFDVDFLNAFNQTWFSGPNLDPTNKDFGRVTSQRGLSRIIQFNFRVTF